MTDTHTFADDGCGTCTGCGLPAGNRRHKVHTLAPSNAPAAPTRLHAPLTSHAAAAAHLPRSGSQKERLLRLIGSRPQGYTCDELEVETGLLHQSASAAVNALVRDRHIVQAVGRDHQGLTRTTRSGQAAIVWVPVPVALDATTHDAGVA